MGLAPYGDAHGERVERWRQAILDEMIDLRPDGSYLLNMAYFNYATGLTMCREPRWRHLFGIGPRPAESELTRDYMDLALAVQRVTETVVLRLAGTARELTVVPTWSWPVAWPSTAWPTASCCVRGSSIGSGSSRRPATPAVPWGPP